MNIPTKEEREAAEKIFGGHGKQKELAEIAAQIIADARPEPSPDAEMLARKLREASIHIGVMSDSKSRDASDAYWEAAAFLTNFHPQSVTVDVEACADEIKDFTEDGLGIENVMTVEYFKDEIKEIISRHLTDTPKPTQDDHIKVKHTAVHRMAERITDSLGKEKWMEDYTRNFDTFTRIINEEFPSLP